MRIGFDNDKYLALQAEHIRERIGQFGGKLYLEFGGKLFDDYHASRVLPGFQPDSKIRMLQQMKPKTLRSSSPSTPTISRRTRCAAIWASPMTKTSCACMDIFRSMGFATAGVVDHPLSRTSPTRWRSVIALTAWASRATCTIPSPGIPTHTAAHRHRRKAMAKTSIVETERTPW